MPEAVPAANRGNRLSMNSSVVERKRRIMAENRGNERISCQIRHNWANFKGNIGIIRSLPRFFAKYSL